MDYEKAYKEALERARAIHNEKQAQCYDIMAKVFPELAESEDEKIMEALLEYFGEQCDMSDVNGFYAYEIYDWLKKQKEQKPIEDKDAIEPTPKQDDSGLTDFERAIHRGFLCAGVENVPVEIIKETAQDCLAHIEQKPNIKYIYPKFRVGDVIKPINPNGSYIPVRVRYIGEDSYTCESDDMRAFYSFPICDENKYVLVEQKTTEWSVEDKFNLRSCIAKIEIDMQHWGKHGKTMVDGDIRLIGWLKSLPERFGLQPKQEWSEEEYGRLFDIEQYLHGTLQLSPDRKIACIDFLKSLRPQPRWKPSEEQMGSLRLAIDSAKKAQMNATADSLNEIYEQLKKL